MCWVIVGVIWKIERLEIKKCEMKTLLSGNGSNDRELDALKCEIKKNPLINSSSNMEN